jgi:hypothetical protein
MWMRLPMVVALAALGTLVPAAPALALVLSLTAGPATTIAPLKIGQTASGTGTLTASSLLGGWFLWVKDSAAATSGFMVKSATGCAGSDAQLTNKLTVTVTGAGTSNGAKTMTTSDVQVAAGGGILSSDTLTTTYSQVIPLTQVMLTGCVYRLTATYTLQ